MKKNLKSETMKYPSRHKKSGTQKNPTLKVSTMKILKIHKSNSRSPWVKFRTFIIFKHGIY